MEDLERFWLAKYGVPEGGDRRATGDDIVFAAPRCRSLVVWLEGDCSMVGHAFSERDRCGVIFDGRLYEPHLVVSAPPRGDVSDARLVLDGYLASGLGIVDQLDGAFCAIIWDARADALFCARDPSGHQPVFYADLGNRLLISPSPDVLAQADGVSSSIDRAAVADWVYRGETTPGATFYADVRRLPQGHLLEKRAGHRRVYRYWNTDIPVRWSRSDPDEALRTFDELLDRAVGQSLGSGRIGVFLSGGVDSGLLAASAAAQLRRHEREAPFAFSLKSPDPETDEEQVQRAVASDLGLVSSIVPLERAVGPEGVLLAGIGLSERSWLPCVNPWNAAYEHLAWIGKRKGCALILRGEGANELLEVGLGWAAEELRRGHIFGLANLWRVRQGRGRQPPWTVARSLLLRDALGTLLRDAALSSLQRLPPGATRRLRIGRRRRRLPVWLAPDRDVRRDLLERWSAVPSYGGRGGPYARELRRSLDSAQRAASIEAAFLMGRTVGVRLRSPFYDSSLLRFAHRVSPHVLSLGSRSKGIAYESYRRRTQGETADQMRVVWVDRYFDDLLDRETPRALAYLGGIRLLEELGIVAPKQIEEALQRRSSEMIHYQRWQTLATESWLRARLS
jgi:asparagine synthetase B (glutamine-hydrolysing)